MDTRYRLNYSRKSSRGWRRGGGIELCQITINTRDKRVIAVICLRSREWNGTHIFRTNACVIRGKYLWIHLCLYQMAFFLVLDELFFFFFFFFGYFNPIPVKGNVYIFLYKFFNLSREMD